jgi:HAD superfamily hydrolase (TIGR01509 family)
MIGDGARALVARAFALPEDDARVDPALARFKKEYAARPCVHTTLLPGAREALGAAPASGLVTNKPRAITLLVLDALGIASAFADGAVWCGDDGPLKPSPAGILSVLARLGVTPSEAWVVGDGPQDVGAGRAAGCFTVGIGGIASRDVLLAARPDIVVESLLDVAKMAADA